MTKQEILKAIENGESVWLATEYGIKELKKLKLKDGLLVYYNEDYKFNHAVEENYFDDLYKTKVEAEHYLHHANVTRTETLPFLTWEEFLKSREIIFTTKKYETATLGILNNKLILAIRGKSLYNYWDLTEANFYKAYDEAVRLFKKE